MHDGWHEVDLILQTGDGKGLAREVKLAAAIDDDRHLLWLKKQTDDDLVDLVIVTTGEQVHRRSDGVAVTPQGLLGP